MLSVVVILTVEALRWAVAETVCSLSDNVSAVVGCDEINRNNSRMKSIFFIIPPKIKSRPLGRLSQIISDIIFYKPSFSGDGIRIFDSANFQCAYEAFA